MPPPPVAGMMPPPPGGIPPPPGMYAPGQEPPPAMMMAPAYELTEEEKKRAELEADEVFMKYVKVYKMTKNLANIKLKMKAEGQYEPALIDMFAESADVKATASYN